MAVQGHGEVLRSLSTYFPDVTYFVGPESVGKWTVAEHLRRQYSIHNDDTLRIHKLSPQALGELAQFARSPAVASSTKLVIIEVERDASALLPYLVPTSFVRYIVISENTLSEVRDRAATFYFRYLTRNEVAKVLVEKYDFDPELAMEFGNKSGGQVKTAVEYSEAENDFALVRKALTAVRTKDVELLEECAKDWSDFTTNLLTVWAEENNAGRWRVFDPTDAVKGRALSLRIQLAIKPQVRPRLVVRSQLMSVLRGD